MKTHAYSLDRVFVHDSLRWPRNKRGRLCRSESSNTNFIVDILCLNSTGLAFLWVHLEWMVALCYLARNATHRRVLEDGKADSKRILDSRVSLSSVQASVLWRAGSNLNYKASSEKLWQPSRRQRRRRQSYVRFVETLPVTGRVFPLSLHWQTAKLDNVEESKMKIYYTNHPDVSFSADKALYRISDMKIFHISYT